MSYAEMAYPKLKKLCANRGLGGAGKAAELLARLEEHDALLQTPAGMAELVRNETPKVRLTDPDPDHPGFPNWDFKGRWIRR